MEEPTSQPSFSQLNVQQTPDNAHASLANSDANSKAAASTTNKSNTSSNNVDKDGKRKMVSIFAMFRFASPLDMLLVICGILCGIANGAGTAAFALILGDMYDAINSPDGSRATYLALLFVYIGIAIFFAAGGQVALLTTASERMTIKLRQSYLNAILSQDIAFFDEQNAGALTSQIAENSILFREALGEKLGSFFQYSSIFVSGIIVGLTFLWQLSLVILALTPLLGASGYFMVKTVSDIMNGQLESYSSAGSVAEETISMIRTVTAFNLQKNKVASYENEVNKAARFSSRQGVVVGIGFGLLTFFFYCSVSIAFYVGTVLVVNSRNDAAIQHPVAEDLPSDLLFCQVGHIVPSNCSASAQGTTYFETKSDICSCPLCRCGCYYVPPGEEPSYISSCVTGGDVILTFFAVLFGSLGIGQAAGPFQTFTNGRIAAASLYKVIDRKSKIDANADAGTVLVSVKGEIKFENVAFTYPTRPDAPVFKSLNLLIPAGKRVALVGESGSGKSTCIALLERYYDPDAGRVLLDGHDLKSLQVKSLRKMIGLVSQEPILFGTTILENVRFGLPEASDEDVYRACRDANADGFIRNFPDGYQTHVTSSLVSGGQKQRIAIARALLRNPPILLLDEATAALDNESERLVNEAIDKLLTSSASGSRTTIVIAHRLSSIRACDRIYVLEKGNLVEEGPHDELIQLDGLYASLNKLSQGATLGKSDKASESALSTSESENKSKDEIKKEEDSTSNPAEDETTTTATDETINNNSSGFEVAVSKPKSYSVWKAFRYAKPERLYFLPAMLGAAGNGASQPIFALLFADVTDIFYYTNASQMQSRSTVYCLAFFAVAVGTFIAILMQNVFFSLISGRMTKRVRAEVFKHILSQEIGFFDEKTNNVGALTAKLASDAALLRAAVSDRMAAFSMNTSTLVTGYVVAMLGSWKVSLVVTALFPALILAGAMEYMIMAGLATTDQKALEQSSHTLSESISGIRTVAAFNMQSSIHHLYLQQLVGPAQKAKRKGFTAGMGYGFSQAVQLFCFALTLWYGAELIKNGEINFREMNQAMFGIFMCAFALGNNAALTPDLAKGKSAVQSIFTLLDRKSKIDPFDGSGNQPSALMGDLEFENVTFSYPTRQNVTVLANFSLKINRGQTVAFVGTSGSGKSTLVLLLERFYDPVSGIVRVDGHNVRTLNVDWLRSQIGIVSQEPALFRGSIKENIRSGNLEATDEDIIEAAKMANAHDFISAFPQGYDTDLQTSLGVSGGQKQRIAIARALIRKPNILLLDEATSALDEESQKVVQQALDTLLQQTRRTTIIVAHRLSTIRAADTIVVLQHGVVVEQGSFAELSTKSGGAFEALLRAQGKIHGEEQQ